MFSNSLRQFRRALNFQAQLAQYKAQMKREKTTKENLAVIGQERDEISRFAKPLQRHQFDFQSKQTTTTTWRAEFFLARDLGICSALFAHQ